MWQRQIDDGRPSESSDVHLNGCTFQSLAGIYKITRYEIKVLRHELAFKLSGTKRLPVLLL